MTDPSNDQITISTNPPLTVTRSTDGVHITASSEGVTIPDAAIPALISAVEALRDTPNVPRPDPLTDALDDREEASDTCPECGDRELVMSLGGVVVCPGCGFERDE